MSSQPTRLTKIIATIGPSCESEEMIAKLIEAGVNVFRFNFKHNSVEWHNEMIERVNQVADKLKIRVGTLIDLQGPEIRINMTPEQLEIKDGELYLLGEDALISNQLGFSITHPEIIEFLKPKQKIIVDDGAFEFEVAVKDNKTYLKAKTTGILKQRKTLNIPGAEFPFPVLIDRDMDGIKLAKRRHIDYVALSFVRSAEDVKILRQEMRKLGVKAKIVSKIETKKAIDDLSGIIEASDGIMVARGDLGVELPFEQVPYFQKLIIDQCIRHGKFAITATQMLQSMITQPLATRAEISDVANASYDLSDAVMLSGETASGEYPLRSVETMRKTLDFNEIKFSRDSRKKFQYQLKGSTPMMAEAAYELYLTSLKEAGIKVKAFVVYTHSGTTAQMLSAYRPELPIYAFCPDAQTAESLTLNYGVVPLVKGAKYKKQMEVKNNHVLAGIEFLKSTNRVQVDDMLIVLHGDFWDVEGGCSTIKLVKVYDNGK